MFYREIFKVLSSYLYFYVIILFVPFILAGYDQFWLNSEIHPQPHATLAFAWTIAICWGFAILCFFLSKGATAILHRKEALATAVFIWFLSPALGALPFYFSGTLESFNQAYFEAASGFTTTGATMLEAKQYDRVTQQEIPIQRTYCGMQETTYTFYGTIKSVEDPITGHQLVGLEAVSRSLLFWRSLMQWLGGMGIILLFIAILPALGVGGKMLFQTETSGPLKEGLTPRIKEAALELWRIYVTLTVAQIFLLLLTNNQIPLFDAITLALSTVSTGGFSIHNENIAYYQHAATEWVILIFMILGSINFSLYYQIIRGKFYRLFEPEFLLYMVLLMGSGIFVATQLVRQPHFSLAGDVLGPYSIVDAIRTGFFQFVSFQTSSGFFIANYDTWPYAIQALFLIVMYLGGMSGSTAGGIKMIRIYLLFQIAKHKIESIFKPKTVKIIRVAGKQIDSGMAISVLCFFLMVVVVSIVTTFVYILDGIDPETALGLTASMVNNTGLAFRAAGPMATFTFLSPFATALSSFVMILGRLEFYAVLVILLPAFWENRS